MGRAQVALKRGACPRCTTDEVVEFHNGPCPFWAAAVEREHKVECQAAGCHRFTGRNDGCCSAVCAARYAAQVFAARSRRGQSVGVHAPTGQERSHTGFQVPASSSSPAASAPAASSDQARSGGIFEVRS